MPYDRLIDDKWTFREADTKEFTHGYHVYPAMMIPQIARTLMNEYAPDKLQLLFDPYMGSGTSLVEASLRNVNSVGTDLNPLARMMTSVKTTHYDAGVIIAQRDNILQRIPDYSEDSVVNTDFSHITNHNFWYSEDVLFKLAYLEQLIHECADNSDFYRLILAEIVREVSYTRKEEFKRYRMSTDRIANYDPDPFALFQRKADRNIRGLIAYNEIEFRPSVTICDFNSSLGIPKNIIHNESVDMVITSPPYGDSRTTVAYGQFSRWANEWFHFPNASNLDNELMGGRSTEEVLFNSTELEEILNKIKENNEKRYRAVVSFLNDYWHSIRNVADVVRIGGRVCYVVGDRRVTDIQIPLDYFTAEMFENCGFRHEITIVREIPNKRMPSLTSPTNRAGNHVQTMTNEYIVILTKTHCPVG